MITAPISRCCPCPQVHVLSTPKPRAIGGKRKLRSRVQQTAILNIRLAALTLHPRGQSLSLLLLIKSCSYGYRRVTSTTRNQDMTNNQVGTFFLRPPVLAVGAGGAFAIAGAGCLEAWVFPFIDGIFALRLFPFDPILSPLSVILEPHPPLPPIESIVPIITSIAAIISSIENAP